MSEFYKILKADPLGDPYESHGNKIQTYWCQVEGQEKAVSIGKQEGNVLRPGQHVYGDLMYAKSQKGTEYWKFKGAKVPDGVQRPEDSAAPSTPANQQFDAPAWFIPYGNMIEAMHKHLGLVDSGIIEGAKPAVKHEPAPTPDEKAKVDDLFNDEFDPAEEIDLSGIPF